VSDLFLPAAPFSRFVSPTRPVEQVSFEDVQRFLERVNERVPKLDLVLPWEAQWEYACRAGTEAATYAGAMSILGERNIPARPPGLIEIALSDGTTVRRFAGNRPALSWRARVACSRLKALQPRRQRQRDQDRPDHAL
jgi:Sulfatase-modifying factor enzyme 1